MFTGIFLYIVIAVLAFFLGITATLLCIYIRKLSESDDTGRYVTDSEKQA